MTLRKLRILAIASLAACGSNAANQVNAPPRPQPPNAEVPEPAASTGGSSSSSDADPLQDGAPGLPTSKVDVQSPGDVDPAAAELAAYASAKPVFLSHCGQCHSTEGAQSTAGARRHFSMDAYPFGGHHSSEIGSEIREVLGVSGAKATMPKDKPGSVRGEELRLILAWADAYDKAHGTPEAEHGHDSIIHDH